MAGSYIRIQPRGMHRHGDGAVELHHEGVRVLKNHHESWYQGKLIKVLKKEMPDAVILKLADKYLMGIPDLCIVYNDVTSWWELKVWRETRNPKLTDFGKGVQRNMAQRLDDEGICKYIIFGDRGKDDQWIWIVNPTDLELDDINEEIERHDYVKLAELIAKCHS